MQEFGINSTSPSVPRMNGQSSPTFWFLLCSCGRMGSRSSNGQVGGMTGTLTGFKFSGLGQQDSW